MKRNDFLWYCLAGTSAALIPNFLYAGKALELPDVLLLGDSISMGYTPYVQDILKGKANVYRPMLSGGNPENCDGTSFGVANVDRWTSSGKWDIIHFNFGLHDIKHVNPKTGSATTNPDDPLQSDLRHYKSNLKIIVGKLKATGARLIFATTTPVPYGKVSPLREPGNVPRYNSAAMRIMKREHVAINDLYNYVLPKVKEIQRPNNVHFTEEGYKELASEVARNIVLLLQNSVNYNLSTK